MSEGSAPATKRSSNRLQDMSKHALSRERTAETKTLPTTCLAFIVQPPEGVSVVRARPCGQGRRVDQGVRGDLLASFCADLQHLELRGCLTIHVEELVRTPRYPKPQEPVEAAGTNRRTMA